MSHPPQSVTGEEALGLEICMLWANASVKSVVSAAAVPPRRDTSDSVSHAPSLLRCEAMQRARSELLGLALPFG